MHQPVLLVMVLCSASLIAPGVGYTGISGPSARDDFTVSPAGSVQAQSSSTEKLSGLPEGVSLQVELTKSLDAKNARSGEEVTAKLMQDVKSNGNVVLQKGSKVIGHVAEAQPRDKQHTESRLVLVFDKAIAKNGQEMSVKTILAAVALPQNPPSAAANDNLSVPQSMGSSSNQMGGIEPGGASRSAGGGSLPGTMDSSGSGVIQANADKSPTGNASTTQGTSSKAVVGSQGISLAQGVITSTSHTVKLESGTQLLLRVAGDH